MDAYRITDTTGEVFVVVQAHSATEAVDVARQQLPRGIASRTLFAWHVVPDALSEPPSAAQDAIDGDGV